MTSMEIAFRAFALFCLGILLANVFVAIGDYLDKMRRQQLWHVDHEPSSLCERPGSISEFYRSYRGK